jgi:hypothetical protein
MEAIAHLLDRNSIYKWATFNGYVELPCDRDKEHAFSPKFGAQTSYPEPLIDETDGILVIRN